MRARGDQHAAGVLEASARPAAARARAPSSVICGLPDRPRGALAARSSRRRSPGCVGLDEEALDLAVLGRRAPTRRRRRRSSRCRSSAWRRRGSSRRRRARARRLQRDASRSRASGSVSANAPIFSSRAIAGSQRCFCSSEPSSAIDFIASPDCTPRNVPEAAVAAVQLHVHEAAGQRAHARAAVALDVLADRPSSASRRISGHGSSAASQ